MKKNYRLYRRVYQSLFVGIEDVFKQYIHSLEPDKIKQLDEYNSKRMGKEGRAGREDRESIGNIQNPFDFLRIFQLFVYLNGCLSLANGILPVLDRETPRGVETTSLKRLYELFKDKKFHGLVSLQFLSALNLLFGGRIEN